MTKKAKYIILTLVFTIGFSLPSCDDDCDCPKPLGSYFDINNVKLINYKKRGDCCADEAKAGQSIMLTDYFLYVKFNVEYYSFHDNTNTKADFSLISNAVACSCLENGVNGTKEKLKELIVITKNDFDNNHLANDTINDLLDISTYGGKQDLQTYLQKDTSTYLYEAYTLLLKKTPVLNKEFITEVTIKLDKGEVYQAIRQPIILE